MRDGVFPHQPSIALQCPAPSDSDQSPWLWVLQTEGIELNRQPRRWVSPSCCRLPSYGCPQHLRESTPLCGSRGGPASDTARCWRYGWSWLMSRDGAASCNQAASRRAGSYYCPSSATASWSSGSSCTLSPRSSPWSAWIARWTQSKCRWGSARDSRNTTLLSRPPWYLSTFRPTHEYLSSLRMTRAQFGFWFHSDYTRFSSFFSSSLSWSFEWLAASASLSTFSAISGWTSGRYLTSS